MSIVRAIVSNQPNAPEERNVYSKHGKFWELSPSGATCGNFNKGAKIIYQQHQGGNENMSESLKQRLHQAEKASKSQVLP